MVKLSLITAVAAIVPALISANVNLERPTLDLDFQVEEDRHAPRSLIMTIPDGTGPNIFKLARAVLDPTMKKRLHIDQFFRGTIQTHSATSYITDSASSATSYASGFKTYDAGIGVDLYRQPLGSIMEAAKARGMVTGLIVTSRSTHATPASFASHVLERDNEAEIARQYVNEQNLDFVLGGGSRFFPDALQANLTSRGYTIARNYEELLNYKNANEASGALRLFGMFASSHMSYEVDRVRDLGANPTNTKREPSLAEMVDMVLSILKNNEQAKKHGFFFMVEGSRVDHAGHANDPGTMAKDTIAFDDAVGVVTKFVGERENIAWVSVADHSTGGFTMARDGVYRFEPKQLQKQIMSGEVMASALRTFANAKSGPCATAGANPACVDAVLDVIKTNSGVEDIKTDKKVVDAVTAAVASSSRSMSNVAEEVKGSISRAAWVGWTTGGHVGTDVGLYCYGPAEFEQQCVGNHDNTHVNKIMANWLNLRHGQDVETMRLRNFQTVEYTAEDQLGNGGNYGL